MHRLTLEPGDRAKAHLHENHETAIYAFAGTSEMWFGSELQHHLRVRAGDMVFIPAEVPHLPMNPFEEPATVVIARTDPSEQEGVVLLPELERFGPVTPADGRGRGGRAIAPPTSLEPRPFQPNSTARRP